MNIVPRATFVPQLTDIVKTMPMPLPVKEQILDQILGHHDDLHRPTPRRQERTPLSVRVAQARNVGAFLYRRTRTDDADVYAYCKNGEPAYEVAVRDGQPLSCTCKSFEFGSLHDPDYFCKHMGLFLEGDTMMTEDEYQALVEDAAQAAAEFLRVWLAWRHGRATSEECDEAGQRDAEAREAAHKALPDVAGTWGEQWAREAAEQKAANAQEGRAA